KIEVVGTGTRPITVTIRVPSRIDLTQKSHLGLVHEVLTRIGVRPKSSAATADDLWTLYPWRHPHEVWRGIFGAQMETLVQAGALGTTQLASVEDPRFPGTGRLLNVVAIPPGEFQGVSDMEEVPPRALTATDVEGLELDPERLRQHLRS